jgi:hypothetical protein
LESSILRFLSAKLPVLVALQHIQMSLYSSTLRLEESDEQSDFLEKVFLKVKLKSLNVTVTEAALLMVLEYPSVSVWVILMVTVTEEEVLLT